MQRRRIAPRDADLRQLLCKGLAGRRSHETTLHVRREVRETAAFAQVVRILRGQLLRVPDACSRRDRQIRSVSRRHDGTTATFTWDVGSQLRVVHGLHLVGELFSGDPNVTTSGGASQAGFRYIFNDQLQVDATAGVGVFGESQPPIWDTSGIRLVSHRLW